MGVHLSASEARELERIVREGRGEARLYRRARMVQMAASGVSISSIARALGTNRTRVSEWLRRYEEEGIEGLVHVSEISKEKIKTPVGAYTVGDMITARVMNINSDERRIGLSIKRLDMKMTRPS